MEALNEAITVLTAMITPAVFVSACGGMILSTSFRLGRVADRVRALSEKLEEIMHSETRVEHYKERCASMFNQLDKLIRRAKILQHSMITFYVALGVFVATTVALGIVAVSGSKYGWLPVTTGLAGVCLLFYGSITLIYEARLALGTLNSEMNFIWHLAKHHAPAEWEKHLAEMH